MILKPQQPMMVLSLLILSLIPLTGRSGNNYTADWDKVAAFEKEGLISSAKSTVEDIYLLAKKESNGPQRIKAITYLSRYLFQLEEEPELLIIDLYKNEIATSASPEKNIVQSMLAELYFNYYNDNSWTILERTALKKTSENEDFRTWDLTRLAAESMGLFLSSVQNGSEVLRQTSILEYQAILTEGDQEAILQRPSIYDLLAQRAIRFLQNTQMYSARAAEQFRIEEKVAFDLNRSFTLHSFNEGQTGNGLLEALKLYQSLIAYHMQDPNPTALIPLQLERLSFVHTYASMADTDSLYEAALDQLYKQYAKSEEVSYVLYEMALFKRQKGSTYQPFDQPEYRFYIQNALHICEKAILTFPNAKGTQNCRMLQAQILAKDANCITEETIPSDKTFPLNLRWKNIDTVYFRIVPLTETAFNVKYSSRNNEFLQFLLAQNALRTWHTPLPDDKDDLQYHSTEIAIEGLPIGQYAVMVSPKEDFALENNAVYYQHIQVSDISYMQYTEPSGNISFYLLDRSTGAALSNAMLHTRTSQYNYETRKNTTIPGTSYKADPYGYVKISSAKNSTLQFTITNGKDTLQENGNLYLNTNRRDDNPVTTNSFLFTDRSIYRPGQSVYVKGIVLQSKEGGKVLQAKNNETVTLYLLDVNGQEVSKASLTTNQYGSYETVFQIPRGGLTGSYQITDPWGNQYISVEEYKRPSFEVVVEIPEQEYRLGDTLQMNGKAMAYSGASISTAEVTYRVVRQANYPYYRWSRYYFPQETETEISRGMTETDIDGLFAYSFVLQDGTQQNIEYPPYYTYTIYIDVTDKAGETRSTETSISAGSISLLLSLDLPEHINAGEDMQMKVTTSTLNGSKVRTDVLVSIYPLEGPQRVFRDKLWQQSDLYTLDRDTYYSLFPNDVYANEDDPNTWVFGKEVSRILIKDSTGLASIQTKNWQPGLYKIVCSAVDRNGREIKDERILEVHAEGMVLPTSGYLVAPQQNFTALPGNSIILQAGTSLPKLKALYTLYRGNEVLDSRWVTLSNAYTSIPIQISELDRGGLTARLSCIRDGRFHSISYQIDVPWDNKKLGIELHTFRDKSEPGSTEHWKLQVTGPGTLNGQAELLAGMYDASLDALLPHNWSFTQYPFNQTNQYWQDGNSIAIRHFLQWQKDWNMYVKGYEPKKVGINWFHFHSLKREEPEVFGFPTDKRYDQDGEGSYKTSAITTDTESLNQQEAMDHKQSVNIPSLRTDLRETAFFYPKILPDSNGFYHLDFILPESITRWKLLMLAHTPDISFGIETAEMVTQKELMITPNIPRFFREGDTITLTARISNIGSNTLAGTARLQIRDVLSDTLVDAQWGHAKNHPIFHIGPGENAAVSWTIIVPDGTHPVNLSFVADAGSISDGEAHTIPVLSNRMLVTKSIPLLVHWGNKEEIEFTDLNQAAEATSLEHVQLRLEMSSNPAWYAVQSMPYLMEYPYECSEQLFNRFYANALSTHLANSNPRLKQVFQAWQEDASGLASNLQLKEELKSALLEETPWVLEARSDAERKQRIALLFDLNRMAQEKKATIQKLHAAQTPNGGFSWFPGMPDNPTITQYILSGWGHLEKLGVLMTEEEQSLEMIYRAVQYIDDRMDERYANLIQNEVDLATYKPDYMDLQYLYARQFFLSSTMSAETREHADYLMKQCFLYWTDYNLHSQAMIALIAIHENKTAMAERIVASLKEGAVRKVSVGMYWNANQSGYHWQESPIETQALMIELFNAMGMQQEVADLRIWLLNQKRTNSWHTTKATAEACYSLLLGGQNWLDENGTVTLQSGESILIPDKLEAGTGFYSVQVPVSDINENSGWITADASSLDKTKGGISWGAVYWQYLQDMDEVTSSKDNPLQIKQQLFRKIWTADGPVLESVNPDQPFKVGDLVVVRLEVHNPANLSYVHIKGVRASCFEPIDVLSGYQWQDGIGYYQSTKDAATHFFLDYMAKGVHVFEYELRVFQAGSFSSGSSSMQCMYAPEFVANSNGIRVIVE